MVRKVTTPALTSVVIVDPRSLIRKNLHVRLGNHGSPQNEGSERLQTSEALCFYPRSASPRFHYRGCQCSRSINDAAPMACAAVALL
jgi:hypothetical protein